MDYINAFIEGLSNFITAFAAIFNRIPWADLINGLLSKIM